ncbi:MAG: lytic transglycosylase domain-containing protein, partial [Bryobacteraceae bacterium]
IVAVPAMAGEYAILSSGFRMHVDSHESANGMVVLHTGQGTLQLPADQVSQFEKDDYVAAPVAATPPAAPKTTPSPQEMVVEAARRAVLPARFVRSVAAVESGFKAGAVSPKGAIGIMQLMPATAAAHGADPHDPRQNVDAGAMYLRELLLKYNGDVVKALAAYNAGPGAVNRYGGLPPFPETQAYVQRVLNLYQKSQP